jgi:hypothetical protein
MAAFQVITEGFRPKWYEHSLGSFLRLSWLWDRTQHPNSSAEFLNSADRRRNSFATIELCQLPRSEDTLDLYTHAINRDKLTAQKSGDGSHDEAGTGELNFPAGHRRGGRGFPRSNMPILFMPRFAVKIS